MPVLLAQGLELLVYGMGTVIVFLTVLVGATRLMSWTVLTYFPEPPPVAGQRTAGGASSASNDPSPELLAAITAAVHLHRQRRGSATDPEQRARNQSAQPGRPHV